MLVLPSPFRLPCVQKTVACEEQERSECEMCSDRLTAVVVFWDIRHVGGCL